ncbi:hypothetical protein ACFE04_006815 [Oxalis oulophora]
MATLPSDDGHVFAFLLLFYENNGARGIKIENHKPFNLMWVATYRKSELEVFQSSADRIFSQDENLSPHMHNKIFKWVKNHAYLGALQKNGKVKLSSHSDIGAADSFDDVTLSESNLLDVVTVKSVPPRRRTKILRDNRVKSSADESLSDKEVSDNDEKVDQLITEGSDNLKEGVVDEKNTINHDGCQDILAMERIFQKLEYWYTLVILLSYFSPLDKVFIYGSGHSNTPMTHILSGASQLGGVDPQLETDKNVDQENSVAPSVSSIVPDLIKPEIKQGETSFLEASSNASICCDHQINGDRFHHLGKISRISSFRKDAPENSHQEISLNPPNDKASVSSQLMTRPKETVTGVVGPRVSFEKYSDSVQPVSEFSKDHPKLCDICRHFDTLLNPILVCYGCKVGVHLDCYRSVNETPGPWYCELCEELSSRTNSAPSANFWEKPYFFAKCFLCGGSAGAFRKSSGDHWVHAFCAERVFETTFRRGQVNPVEGLEAACRGVDICRVIKDHENNGAPTVIVQYVWYMTFLLFHENNGVTGSKIEDHMRRHSYCFMRTMVPERSKIENQPFNLMRVATYRKYELEVFQSSANINFSQQQGLMAWGKSRAHWNIIGKNVSQNILICVIVQNEAKLKLLLRGDNVTENNEQIQETEKLLNVLLDVDAQI